MIIHILGGGPIDLLPDFNYFMKKKLYGLGWIVESIHCSQWDSNQ